MTRTLALTVRFRRWNRRSPLECRRCGAAIVDANAHASWHASLEAGARWRPEDAGMWSERTRTTEVFAISVGDDGWPFER